MNPLYSDLQWLPRPPQDFSIRLKALRRSAESPGSEIRSLASFGLNLNQLTKLAKVIDDVRTDGGVLAPLVPFRLALLSNATVDMIGPALLASAARHGIALEIIQPSYDQVAQEAMTPDSKVNSSRPDAVLFALDYRGLPLTLSLGDAEGGFINHAQRARLPAHAARRYQKPMQRLMQSACASSKPSLLPRSGSLAAWTVPCRVPWPA